jgi:hypothetical protein
MKRGFLSKKWKEGYFVLYENSVIECFEKQSDSKPIHNVILKDVCQYLSVGPFTRCVPGEFLHNLIAFQNQKI